MNAFSPRDYTINSSKMQLPKYKFNKSNIKTLKVDGWYDRFDNNEWRPVLDSVSVSLHRICWIQNTRSLLIKKHTDIITYMKLDSQHTRKKLSRRMQSGDGF